ncbi:hypothetical protein ACJX0J_002209, partial [Zea mays]
PQPRAAGEIRTSLSVILAEGEKVAPADSLAAVAAWVLLPWRLASEDGDRSTSHRGSDSHGFCSSEEKCPKVAIVFQKKLFGDNINGLLLDISLRLLCLHYSHSGPQGLSELHDSWIHTPLGMPPLPYNTSRYANIDGGLLLLGPHMSIDSRTTQTQQDQANQGDSGSEDKYGEDLIKLGDDILADMICILNKSSDH